MTCPTCGGSLFLGLLCDRCAMRAANDPAFAATEAGQAALAAAYRVAAIARRAASRPAPTETQAGYRNEMREAGRGGLLP